jgi:hypothetical protein
LVLSLLAASCAGSAYVPPTAKQPHAVLRFRRSYQTTSGDQLDEGIRVNGEVAFRSGADADAARSERTDTILIRPDVAQIDVAASFSHFERYVGYVPASAPQPPPTAEPFHCGTQVCLQSSTDHAREYRPANEVASIVDQWCEKTLRFVPTAGGVYLIDFVYRGDRLCTVTCSEQGGSDPSSARDCPVPKLR